MTATYKREMNHNYMIIDSPDQEPASYECRMLAGNGIEGLLKFRLRYQEEKEAFYYEITSKQPLRRMLERKMISGSEIRSLLLGIAGTLNRIEEYLLKEEQILLEPDYIYIEPDGFSVYLCMVPGYCCDFPAAFSALLKYLLEKVDHQDKDGVVLAYNLYHESLKENYGMPDLLSYLSEQKDEIFQEEQKERTDWEAAEELPELPERRMEEPARRIRERPERRIREPERRAEEPERHRERPERRIKESGRHAGFASLLKCVIGAAAGEVLLWLLMGETGIYKYGAAVGLVAAAAFGAVAVFRDRGKEAGKKKSEENPASGRSRTEAEEKETWRMMIGETGDEPEQKSPDIHKNQEGPAKIQEPETTLLAECGGGPQTVIFESLSRERENIKIPYVPFIIGKHEELTDYCLRQPTVSRIHLRVDQKEGVYIVTDLNSTNGTIVEGYRLQANETVSISNGSTVYLADAGYRFIEEKG